jgi:hypothetical protein
LAASVINSEVSFRQLLETAADTTADTPRAFTLSNNPADLRHEVSPLSRINLYNVFRALSHLWREVQDEQKCSIN